MLKKLFDEKICIMKDALDIKIKPAKFKDNRKNQHQAVPIDVQHTTNVITHLASLCFKFVDSPNSLRRVINQMAILDQSEMLQM